MPTHLDASAQGTPAEPGYLSSEDTDAAEWDNWIISSRSSMEPFPYFRRRKVYAFFFFFSLLSEKKFEL